MGCVYAAHDTALDRPVAIKFMAELGQEACERFRSRPRRRPPDAPLMSSPVHSAVGARSSFTCDPSVRGQSLDQLPRPLPESGRVPGIDRASDLARDWRRRLITGVPYRDIKPGNASLHRRWKQKVSCWTFGLAAAVVRAGKSRLPRRPPAPSLGADPSSRFVEAGRREPTPQATLGIVRGALPAAAAEASAARSTHPYRRRRRGWPCRGAAGNAALHGAGSVAWQARQSPGDVYSLGATLFELAAGRPGLAARTDEPRRATRAGPDHRGPPLRTVAPQVSPDLAALIDRCLRRDPSQRPASGDEVRVALEDLLQARQQPPAKKNPAAWLPFCWCDR